jgi:hypothetical protein
MKLWGVKNLLALSLIIFLSETCCLLCCGAMSLTVRHCPLEKTAHCNSASADADLSASISREGSGKTNFCPFISKRYEPAPRTEANAKNVASQSLAVALPKLQHSDRYFYISPARYSSPIRDRGGTYIANCVFRI